jgi:NAD(P)-dependent dehydrogenase (short-subunit alcohol dehydrogenase family)
MSGSGRSALVTGASTGIGRAIALALDGAGFRVFAGVRKEADGQALRAAASPRLEPLRLDVTDAEQRLAAAQRIDAAVGAAGLYGLVNNAGVALPGPLEFLDLDDLRRSLEVNSVAPVAMGQAFLPLLRRARGRIVHVGSSSGYLATSLMGAYAASKFALEALSDAQRRELRSSGADVEVVLVEPGAIATPIWDKGLAHGEQLEKTLAPEALRAYGKEVARLRDYAHEAAGRAIPPERVAEVVLRALTAPRPRARYRVGVDATIGYWLSRLLPDRVLDRVLERLTRA